MSATLHYSYIDYTEAFCGARTNQGTPYTATTCYADVTCDACKDEVGR